MAYTKEQIIAFFTNERTRERAIGKALAYLNSLQTYDEKRDKDSKYKNHVGFSQCDAKAGTTDAIFFKMYNQLSPERINYWMKKNKKGVPRIAKYWRQLMEKANEV